MAFSFWLAIDDAKGEFFEQASSAIVELVEAWENLNGESGDSDEGDSDGEESGISGSGGSGGSSSSDGGGGKEIDWDDVAKEMQKVMGHDEEKVDENGDAVDKDKSETEKVLGALDNRSELGHVPKGTKTNVGGVIQVHPDSDDYACDIFMSHEPGSKMTSDPSVVNRTVSNLRRTLQANDRSRLEVNLKRGPKLNGRALHRVATGGEDIFAKRSLPKKLDYHFVIMLDCSGSTYGRKMTRIRETGMALGDILKRANIPFEMYGHTANYMNARGGSAASDAAEVFGGRSQLDLVIGHIKGPREHWNEQTRDVLRRLDTASANLDGHAMQFARLKAEQSGAKEAVVVYLSDGEMPAENYSEEKEVLIAECAHIKKTRGLTAIGLGIECDSPTQYGLETLQIDEQADLVKIGPFISKFIK